MDEGAEREPLGANGPEGAPRDSHFKTESSGKDAVVEPVAAQRLEETGSPSLDEILTLLGGSDSPARAARNSRVPPSSQSGSSPSEVVFDHPTSAEACDNPTEADPTLGNAEAGAERAQDTKGEPRDFPSDKMFPLALDHTNIPAAESFGILRSRLLRVQGKGIRSFLITSPGVKEGKTLAAVNLGLSFGQLAQKRVLLIDGDLRASGVTRVLKLANLPGLGDILIGEKPYDAVTHPTRFPCLFVVPAGKVPEKALPELLEGPTWPSFLDHVKQHFDLVIVDSVPADAPVADLELLSAPCDAVLLVVQMRKTTRESLARIQTRLDRRKLLGVLANGVDQGSDYHGYYYYRERKQK